ncbi:MAG: UDP-N-acetylglucosamine--N-acetylmuramyl-(pentapeptide) pyrophosphoryl-undecaprenol N-acetylglucosamine transferase, partial [Pirellulales bacterium]
MNANQPTIFFSGGGTGGHLFPGLAVADALADCLPGVQIGFLGTRRGFEERHIRPHGYRYIAVPAHPVPRSAPAAIRFVRDYARGLRQARRELRRHQAVAVIGLGGYASVPGVRAALGLEIPAVILEQNVVPGRANRWLARAGAAVFAAFNESRTWFSRRADFHWTGTPVRRQVAALATGAPPERPTAPGMKKHRPTLLVMGGSQGARSLNDAVPRAVVMLPELRGWRVVHQTGPADACRTRAAYEAESVWAETIDFLDDVAAAYARADLVICRAGGATLAELACAGLPALLVPYPHAASDHQRRNA